MKKLIFIDHGNSFRSPVAEAIFNHNSKEGWKAYSYGTAVIEQKTEGLKLSESPFPLGLLINEMKKRGIDISQKCCEQLLPEYLEEADKVVSMVEKEYIPDWLSSGGYEHWEVINPEVHTIEIVNSVIDKLTEKIEILKKSL